MNHTSKSIYEKRIDCFQKLMENQKLVARTDEEYISVSIIEGKPHENALNRLGIYQKEYKTLFEQCKTIIFTK